MTNETGLIAGEDVLLIIEALDHHIRYGQDPAPYDRQGYDGFMRLSARLKLNMGMSWSEGSRWWLGRVLRDEREQFGAAVLHRMLLLLKSPGPMTRGQFRRAMVETLKEFRETQFYKSQSVD